MDPVVHFEMPYQDAERLTKFYSDTFGWKMQQFGEEMGNYVLAHTTETDEQNMVKIPGNINGGFAPKSEANPHPSVVISVKDINASMKKVTAAGGNVHGEPMEIPGIGKYVNFTDTEGNQASMLEPAGEM